MKFLLAVVFFSWSVCAQDSANAPEPPEAPKIADTLGEGEFLLLKEPGVVTGPLDFGQIARQKLVVFSTQGLSWTANQIRVEGMNAADPYQPGRPLLFPDPSGVAEVRLVRDQLNRGPLLQFSFRTADTRWHFNAGGFFTGSPLSSSNLPAPALRGTLQ